MKNYVKFGLLIAVILGTLIWLGVGGVSEAGATVSERQRLAALIGELRDGGTTVMVIEHNVPFVMSVSDQVVVLDFGKVVADGTPAEIGANPVVQEISLGS